MLMCSLISIDVIFTTYAERISRKFKYSEFGVSSTILCHLFSAVPKNTSSITVRSLCSNPKKYSTVCFNSCRLFGFVESVFISNACSPNSPRPSSKTFAHSSSFASGIGSWPCQGIILRSLGSGSDEANFFLIFGIASTSPFSVFLLVVNL